MPIDIGDSAGSPDAADWLRSEPVQQLMAGHVDRVQLVRVKSYHGKAFVHRRHPRRTIRLNVAADPNRADLTLVLCHELAHHVVGVRHHHAARWREAYAALVRRAGDLGLLSEERVHDGVDAALHGPASAGANWRDRRADRTRDRRDAAQRSRHELEAAGVGVGAQVSFEYRGRRWLGEVTRMNRLTASVDAASKTYTHFRVPYQRLCPETDLQT